MKEFIWTFNFSVSCFSLVLNDSLTQNVPGVLRILCFMFWGWKAAVWGWTSRWGCEAGIIRRISCSLTNQNQNSGRDVMIDVRGFRFWFSLSETWTQSPDVSEAGGSEPQQTLVIDELCLFLTPSCLFWLFSVNRQGFWRGLINPEAFIVENEINKKSHWVTTSAAGVWRKWSESPERPETE